MNNMLDYYIKRQESLTDLSPSSKKYNWEADKLSMNYNFYVELNSMSSQNMILCYLVTPLR